MLCRNARCRRNIPADAAAIRFQSSKGSRKPRRPPGHGSGNASERPLRPKRFAARSCRRPGPEVSETVRRRTIYVRPPKGLLRFQVSPAARFPMFRYFATGRVPLSLPKTKETYGTQDRNILRELDRNDPIPRGTDCPENGVSKADTHDVADAAPDTIDGYDGLLLDRPHGATGDLQDDWYGFSTRSRSRDLSGQGR